MGKHFVPQLYLAGFADSTGLIWQHDAGLNQVRRIALRTATSRRDAWPDYVERHLTDNIENPANKLVKKMRELVPLNPSERAVVARYIYLLWKRVPAFRAKMSGHVPGIAADAKNELVAAMTLARSRSEVDEQAWNSVLSRIEHSIDEFSANPPEEFWHTVLTSQEYGKAIDLLVSMNWAYLTSRNVFVTSDNPVFIHEGIGLAHAHSELSIPISSGVVLWATRGRVPAAGSMEVPKQWAVELNRRTLQNATRFAFAPNECDWIIPLMRKAKRPAQRLVIN